MSRSAERLQLLALLALAAALRLPRLDEVPRGFYFDEAAVVAEARCLRETGRDLRGAPWPVFVRALDDWKPPEHVYSIAATGPLLGDDVTGARRYVALVGVAAVAATWWLGREVLGRGPGALLAAGLLAVSPWHLQFSRIVWPASTLVLLQTLALAALVRAVRLGRDPAAGGWLGLGGALWGLVTWTYAPAKLWVPLLGAALVALAVARARAWPFGLRATGLGLLAFAATAGPFVAAYLAHRDVVDLRFRSLSVLGQPDALAAVARGYAAHLSLDFLVLEGDPNQRHSPPGVGQLLWAELPLALAGIAALARDRRPGAWLVVAWLALAPVLGALTVGAPHATRTVVALPAVQLAAARGALALVALAAGGAADPARRRRRRLAALTLGAATAASAVVAVRAVLVLAPARTDPTWWRPDVGRVVDTAADLAAREGLAPVVFLPGSRVTWVDWVYLRRVPTALLHAHAAETARGADRYDPLDQAGVFRFTGAACPTPGGAPVALAPGALVVEGPGDALPPGASGWDRVGPRDDPVARYWRVR